MFGDFLNNITSNYFELQNSSLQIFVYFHISSDPMDVGTYEAINLAETADPGNIDMVKLEPVVEIETTPE